MNFQSHDQAQAQELKAEISQLRDQLETAGRDTCRVRQQNEQLLASLLELQRDVQAGTPPKAASSLDSMAKRLSDGMVRMPIPNVLVGGVPGRVATEAGKQLLLMHL